MPVTIFPSPEKTGCIRDPSTISHHALFSELALNLSCTNNSFPNARSIKIANRDKANLLVTHHSFSDLNSSATAPRIVPYPKGFVHGIIHAFQQDLHLVLRPDDVCLAVITQFAFYVTGHAEELRSKFVAHEGTKNLVLEVGETPCAGSSSFKNFLVDAMSRKLTCLIEEQLVDK
jgi:hypothetical protein